MFGPAFQDSISPIHYSLKFKSRGNDSSFAVLSWWLVLGGVILTLSVRLFQLQVMAGDDNRQMADEQRIRLIQVPAARGLITDRNDQLLVQNQPIFRQVHVDPQAGVRLVPIAREQAILLEAGGGDANLIEAVGRKYLYGQTTAQLMGYLGEVSLGELEPAGTLFQLGDLIGRGGIESAFDEWLRGKNGARLVEVDTAGHLIRQVGSEAPIPGRRLQLTVDIELQQAAFQALKQTGTPGAVVISQAKTGQILAVASYPSYDPDIFNPASVAQTDEQLLELFNHPQRPLINRTIAAVYPPGSTFKIITSAAALETGAIASDYTYEDTGIIRVGDYEYTNWYLTQHGGREGIIDIRRALARSTDTFFYKVGEIVGPQELADWSRKFGLGSLTGIELNEELPGLVPDPEWKIKTIGEKWFLGNTYHMAIGQGDLLTTPLQVNLLTSVIANGGKLCPPRLVKAKLSSENLAFEYPGCTDLNISPETISLITQGMVAACSAGGTAFPFFNFQPQVACKTGTAEFGPADEKGERQTHAWLTAFAPVPTIETPDRMPEITVTVLLESGGEGSRDAAPIALEIFKSYFANSD